MEKGAPRFGKSPKQDIDHRSSHAQPFGVNRTLETAVDTEAGILGFQYQHHPMYLH